MSPKVNRLRLQPRSVDPVSPAEGDLQYADGSVREEGLWVYKNSAWTKVGADIAGSINYISNSDAETGNTSGWALGNVALTSKFPSGVPTFGSGASGTLSFTNTSSTPLAGTRSFLLADSAATTPGNFVASDEFTIDNADKAKILNISFAYQLASGAINASGTSNNTVGIAIYDVTAAVWIMPAGVWSITQSSGPGQAVATFQTSFTSSKYRLVLFVANATSGAVGLKLDRLSVGPQTIVQGSPITDWATYTPTLSTGSLGANVTNVARWRRVGSDAEIEWFFEQSTAGSAGSGDYTFTLPSGLKIDTAKLPIGAENRCGEIKVSTGSDGLTTGTGTSILGYVYATTATTIGAAFVNISGGTYQQSFRTWSSTNLPFNVTSNVNFSIKLKVPVVGWSSSVDMSSDTDTRVVAAMYEQVGAQTITNSNSQINFNTKYIDTHAAMSSATYTAPVSGIYEVSASVVFTSNTTTGGQYGYLTLYKNGSALYYLNEAYTYPSGVVPQGLSGSGLVELKAGETTAVYARFSSGQANCNNSVVSIKRLSGPAVVAASETVVANAALVSNNVGTGPLRFDTILDDTHAAITTGAAWKFTAPVTGYYAIELNTDFHTQSSYPAYFYVYVNGSLYGGTTDIAYMANRGGNTLVSYPVKGSKVVKLNAGQYVDIRSPQGVSSSDSPRGTISIFKI